jgi:hypothetical protein
MPVSDAPEDLSLREAMADLPILGQRGIDCARAAAPPRMPASGRELHPSLRRVAQPPCSLPLLRHRRGLRATEDAGDIPDSVRFRPAAELTPEDLAAIAEQVRVRVLRWFARSGLIEPDDVPEMLAWDNSGFSLDAAVRVGAHDRAGLERLLRYCDRPPFALERLELIDEQQVIYRLPRTQRDGTTALSLTPLELIDHLAALIPPPRRHRHRYHGVLAPNAPLRAAAARRPSAFRKLSPIVAGAVGDGNATGGVTRHLLASVRLLCGRSGQRS